VRSVCRHDRWLLHDNLDKIGLLQDRPAHHGEGLAPAYYEEYT